MTLDEYLTARFGPVFDALNDAGGLPDELMECLKWGAVCEMGLMVDGQIDTEGNPADDRPLSYFDLAFMGHRLGSSQAVAYFHGNKYRKSEPGFGMDVYATPDRIFPHLSHLIEQESLT